jgi:translocation protein SEC63
MKLSQMAVQGLQQFKSPLLQLPHIEEDNLRRVSNHKKVCGLLSTQSLATCITRECEEKSFLDFVVWVS